MSLRKNAAEVDYPDEIEGVGQLRAECMHGGSYHGGHYTANRRVCNDDGSGAQWFDDLSDDAVRRERLPRGPKRNIPNAYIHVFDTNVAVGPAVEGAHGKRALAHCDGVEKDAPGTGRSHCVTPVPRQW